MSPSLEDRESKTCGASNEPLSPALAPTFGAAPMVRTSPTCGS